MGKKKFTKPKTTPCECQGKEKKEKRAKNLALGEKVAGNEGGEGLSPKDLNCTGVRGEGRKQ